MSCSEVLHAIHLSLGVNKWSGAELYLYLIFLKFIFLFNIQCIDSLLWYSYCYMWWDQVNLPTIQDGLQFEYCRLGEVSWWETTERPWVDSKSRLPGNSWISESTLEVRIWPLLLVKWMTWNESAERCLFSLESTSPSCHYCFSASLFSNSIEWT